MNEELDIEEILEFREILEAFAKIPKSKRKECKDRIISIMELLSKQDNNRLS